MITETAAVVHDALKPIIKINVSRQQMEVIRHGQLVAAYPVSTSKYGLGTEPGSYKTPLGKFRISERIGAGAPLWSVFKSRVPTGQIAEAGGQEDLILTRILWLDGLEVANANTHARYVYIHGTNQESQIGTPASHGCVRMRNADIAALFEIIPDNTVVEITT